MEQPFPYQNLFIALPGALLLDMGILMQEFLSFQNHLYLQGFGDMTKVH